MSIDYKPVENNINLIRDRKSNAIVNTNVSAYKAAKIRKEKYKKSQALQDEINDLKKRLTALEKIVLEKK